MSRVAWGTAAVLLVVTVLSALGAVWFPVVADRLAGTAVILGLTGIAVTFIAMALAYREEA